MAFSLRFTSDEGLLLFEHPARLLRARTAEEARAALDAADAALRSGFWIAGYLSYELGAALAGLPAREGATDLLAIGLFGAPVRVSHPSGDPSPRDPLSPLLPMVSRRRYDAAIAAIRSAIRDGEVYQVNYTLPMALRYGGDAAELWHALATVTGARYQAYVRDDASVICSWSPELFLAFDGAIIRTKPMKGTAAPGAITALQSEKNRAEHLMIVDLLRNDLHRICTHVWTEALFAIESYPTFATMTSTIAGHLRSDTGLRTIFEATFPCGSVTGAPKRAAMEAIAAHERHPRGVYCGSIGFLSPERRGWWNVAIRTAQFSAGGSGRYDAGGGIVSDSVASDEYAELLLKAAFLGAHADEVEVRETLAADAPAQVRDRHLARMHRSARAFGIAFDRAAVRTALDDALGRARPDRRSLVRLRLRNGGRAFADVEPMIPLSEPVPICIATHRVLSSDPFLRHKTAWRPHHDAAAREANERECFDALLCNERGEITEGSRTTLFVQIGGRLYTPPIRCGLLPGILRGQLRGRGLVEDRVVFPEDLRRAEALYVGNSARGLMRAVLTES
jgi:para-aminobenzoate synthetase/4-amino-4-deoxychorismate lyase